MERRKDERYVVNNERIVRVKVMLDKTEWQDVYIKNISLHGVGLSLLVVDVDVAVKVDKNIYLKFFDVSESDTMKEILELKGFVRWGEKDNIKNVIKLGVQFDDIKENDKKIINEIIELVSYG